MKERATHEFVRQFCLLKEFTRNDPSNLVSAVGQHPELAIALKRLGEISGAIHRYSKSARYREFPAHPQFRRARSEFDDRWASDLGEYQDYEYVQALSQMAETFLSGYRLLRDRAGNDVTAVQRARATYKELDHVIDELWKIYDTLQDHRRGFSRLIKQTTLEFCGALADVKQRWFNALEEVHFELLWDGLLNDRPPSERAAGAVDHKWLDDLLGSLPPPPHEPPDKSRFDPYHDSIADCSCP